MDASSISSTGTGSFRVSVSLTHYFEDERALCYMAAEGTRLVRWLARRVRRTFGLPERVALRCRGHLLPPAEPLSLLRPDDALEVIPAKRRVVDLSRDAKRRSLSVRRRSEASVVACVPASMACVPASVACVPAWETSPTEVQVPVHANCDEGEEALRLQEGKRRALALLALHDEHDEHNEHDEPPPPRRRRRRARRRRDPALAAVSLPLADVDADVVIRNECGDGDAQRLPRRVAALLPACGGTMTGTETVAGTADSSLEAMVHSPLSVSVRVP